jgi:hypothetical protein
MVLTIVIGVLVVWVVCLFALVGLELVHRLVPVASRRQHNGVAGFIYAAFGVIYAVLLALVVIAAASLGPVSKRSLSANFALLGCAQE